jgi:hypothetical protein
MKAGLLRKVAKSYAPFFSEEWKLIGSEFLRVKGDWVQFATFNAMRGADRYVPRTSCEFLNKPGASTASLLGEELLYTRSGTQNWVAATSDPNELFPKMCAQFFPPLQSALEEQEIKKRLNKNLSYWPCPYVLCLISAEEGNALKANEYFCSYKSATFLELMTTPEKLKAHLDSIRTEKLKELKFV